MSSQFQWREVDSSNVAKIAYIGVGTTKAEHKDGDLLVTFKNGGVYRYFNVPSTTFASMCRGDLSVGRFLNSHVKVQGIRYLKLVGEEIPQ